MGKPTMRFRIDKGTGPMAVSCWALIDAEIFGGEALGEMNYTSDDGTQAGARAFADRYGCVAVFVEDE